MTRHRQTATLLPIEQLLEHPGNVRRDLGPDEEIQALGRTIMDHGLLEPLVVTQHHTQPDRYIVLSGHRRLAACLQAGLKDVPVVVRHHVEDRDQIVLMLLADIHRRPLDAIERAEAYGALRNQGLTLKQIGRQVGTNAANVSRSLVLLELDEADREEVRQGRLGAYEAISQVRAAHQSERESNGQPLMGRTKFRQSWFSTEHRLADRVTELCSHLDRPAVAQVGCGVCWEQAIREEPAESFEAAVELAAHTDTAPADPVVVERILGGDFRLQANRAERVLVVEGWLQRDGSLKQLATCTGWKVERYLPTARARLKAVAS